MALYDDKFDWYDLFVPFSTTRAMTDNINNALGIFQPTSNNAMNVSKNKQLEQNIATNSLTPFYDTYEEELLTDNQAQQNAMNVKWAEYERATRIPTQVEQLKSAGLNPVLAATSLGGASSAPIAMSNTTKQTEMNNMTSLVSSALSLLGMVLLKKL